MVDPAGGPQRWEWHHELTITYSTNVIGNRVRSSLTTRVSCFLGMSRQTPLIGSMIQNPQPPLRSCGGMDWFCSAPGKATSVVGESQWARECVQNTEYLSRITETCPTAGGQDSPYPAIMQ